MRCLDAVFHFHRFQNDQQISVAHLITGCDDYLDDLPRHWRRDDALLRRASRAPGCA